MYIYIYVYMYIYIYVYVYMYIYVYLKYLAVQQKLTQGCKSTILQQN